MKFKEFLKRLFTENIPYKLIAIGLALIFWIAFVNTEDPVTNETYRIPLEVRNLEQYDEDGHFIEMTSAGENLQDITLTVYVRARISVLKEISGKKAEDVIRAYVDVFEAEAGHLDIHYSVSEEYADQLELVTLSNRSYLDVSLEEIGEKEIPVLVVISGETAPGHLFRKDDPGISVSEEKIVLRGPASRLANISAARAEYDLDGASDDLDVEVKLRYVDGGGREIALAKELRASAEKVRLTLPVYTVRTLNVRGSWKGEAPEGYVFRDDLRLSSTSFTVYGPKAVAESAADLVLPAIDLSKVVGDYSKEYDLQALLDELYEGRLILAEGSRKLVVTLSTEKKVTAEVEPDPASVRVEGYGEEWTVTVVSVDPVVLYGLKDRIEALKPELGYSVDLSGRTLHEGTVKTELTVRGLGTGVVQQGEALVTLRVEKK